MKLLAISDLHGNLPDLPECDVLAIAGDVCPIYDHSLSFQKQWLLGSFTQWLRRQPAKCIIGIAGNHDLALYESRDLGDALPWNYLLDTGYCYGGVWFHGTPWTPGREDSFFKFHGPDDFLWSKALAVQPDTNIIISHGPPHGKCDYTSPEWGSCHAGWRGWNSIFTTVEPDLFICGHIHTGYGWDKVTHPLGNETIIANVSFCEDPPEYKPTQQPVMFDVTKDAISVVGSHTYFSKEA